MTSAQRILNLALFPVILILAFLIVKVMISSKPERAIRTPPVVIASVSYIESTAQTITPTITTYGNIRSYYEAQLSAQVTGEIIRISPAFNSGQSVNKGDILVEIDPANYLAIIAKEEAALASAEQALSEEKIRSRLAAEDWTRSGRALADATALTLRQPQLGAANATVASAQAILQKAQLDLDRTKIQAPYDAIVQSRTASPGNVVNTGSTLGTLVAKERAEIRLPLTPDQVKRLTLPLNDSSRSAAHSLEATLTTPSQPGITWTATISRTEPSVDAQNQVLYVVGEIESPFDDPQAFLPIGAFVDARIAADPIINGHDVPKTALVEDAYIWLIDENTTLRKQAVTRILSEEDRLILRISGSPPPGPLKIATRPLASFREGQAVKPIPFTK